MTLLNKLERRVIDISYNNNLSHLSSCLMTVNIIDKIYKVKAKRDIFILSNGHAGLALYVVLEKYHKLDAERLFGFHGVHPSQNLYHRIYASTGSLGHGIGIAVGAALANRKRNVFVLMSDGECAEGSVSEALRIATENKLENLRVIVVANGMGAYGKIDIEYLRHRIQTIYPLLITETNMFKYPDFLNGQEGHYHVLTEEEYKEVITV